LLDLPVRKTRSAQDQGNPLSGVVDGERVRHLPVLAKALAVVARDHEEGAPFVPASRHQVYQAAQLRVREGDLTRVGMGGRLGEITGRWFVAGMGVVEVHPQEEARRRGLEPTNGSVDDPISGALREPEITRGATRSHAIFVAVESPSQPVLPIEHDRPYEGGRRKTPLAHPLCQRGEAAIELEGRVVAHPVPRRIEPRHQRGMRRQGEGRRRDRGLEAHAALGQRVEHRGADPAPSVAPEVIRAKRVDRDENDAIHARARHTARCEGPEQSPGEREAPRVARRSHRFLDAPKTLHSGAPLATDGR